MNLRIMRGWASVCLAITALGGALAPANAADTSYAYEVIHSFTAEADGKRYPRGPQQGVVLATNGWLYGHSSEGGGRPNAGTLFRVHPVTGASEVLRHFGQDEADGVRPSGPLIEQPNGHFIGVTESGGLHGWGRIFDMDPQGHTVTIHDFTGGPGGAFPQSPPILASDGWRYGVTAGGGRNDNGIVYRLSPEGEFQLHHSFRGQHRDDGETPLGPLVQGPDGWLYGVTREGGTSGRGTIFRIATDGRYERLHDFSPGKDGTNPHHPLMLASDGRVYGSTSHSGAHRYGTLFRVGKHGRPQTLHAVDPSTQGVRVTGVLAEGHDRKLYFTLAFGLGDTNKGPLMRLDPRLGGAEVMAQPLNSEDGVETLGTLAIAPDGSFYGTTQLSHETPRGPGGGVVYRFSPR